MMEMLARQVMSRLELRRVSNQLAEALEHVKTLHGMLPICAWCKRIRDDHGYWSQAEAYVKQHSDAEFTHGICPECLEKVRPSPVARAGRMPASGRENVSLPRQLRRKYPIAVDQSMSLFVARSAA